MCPGLQEQSTFYILLSCSFQKQQLTSVINKKLVQIQHSWRPANYKLQCQLQEVNLKLDTENFKKLKMGEKMKVLQHCNWFF